MICSFDSDLGGNSGAVCVFNRSEAPADLALIRNGSVSVPGGGTLFFNTQVNNNMENPISGDFWLSVLLPSMNELLIP
jgi:hypothetical protein